MNLNRYTQKAQEAMAAAQQFSDRAGHPEVLPEHLLLALLDQPDGIVPAVLGKMQIDAASLRTPVQALVSKLPSSQGGAQPGLSSRLRRVTQSAEQEAERLKDEYTSTEHLLLAIASETGRASLGGILQPLGVTRDAILSPSRAGSTRG
jgi:ATP-dependent Clp protease ATP-binding subunit ClpB